MTTSIEPRPRWVGVGTSTDPDSTRAGSDAAKAALRGESEIRRVARRAGGAPVSGFYTYGEIARTRGTGGFHNQTLVLLAMG